MPTNFSGQLYQFDSVPVGSAGIPFLTPRWDSSSGTTTQEYGKYYWVGKGGDDNNDGSTWEKRKATIAAAITLANGDIDTGWAVSPWAPSAVIIIGPGSYDENLTALPYGCAMVGLGVDVNDGQSGVKISPSSGSAVVATSVINSQFHNIGFRGAAGGTNFAFDANVINNCRFYNCDFAGPAETYTTGAALQVSDATSTYWIGCRFHDADKGIWVDYVDGGDKFAHCVIDDCIFEGLDTAGVQVDANMLVVGSVVRNSDFFGGGTTMAAGFVVNANGLAVNRCTIQATAGASSGGAQVVQANGCYVNGSLADTDLV